MEIKSFFWIYIVLILCLISLILISTFSSKVTTRVIEKESLADEKGFTKAICNENNYCKDYKIICDKNNVKSLTPTGFAIQNPENWNNPRTPEQIDKVCD